MEWGEESLKKLDRAIQQRLLKRLEWLAANAEDCNHEPYGGDLAGLMKAHVENKRYRALYVKDDDARLLVVHLCCPREWDYEKIKRKLRSAGVIG